LRKRGYPALVTDVLGGSPAFARLAAMLDAGAGDSSIPKVSPASAPALYYAFTSNRHFCGDDAGVWFERGRAIVGAGDAARLADAGYRIARIRMEDGNAA